MEVPIIIIIIGGGGSHNEEFKRKSDEEIATVEVFEICWGYQASDTEKAEVIGSSQSIAIQSRTLHLPRRN